MRYRGGTFGNCCCHKKVVLFYLSCRSNKRLEKDIFFVVELAFCIKILLFLVLQLFTKYIFYFLEWYHALFVGKIRHTYTYVIKT